MNVATIGPIEIVGAHAVGAERQPHSVLAVRSTRVNIL
jgi:hypothetical protein